MDGASRQQSAWRYLLFPIQRAKAWQEQGRPPYWRKGPLARVLDVGSGPGNLASVSCGLAEAASRVGWPGCGEGGYKRWAPSRSPGAGTGRAEPPDKGSRWPRIRRVPASRLLNLLGDLGRFLYPPQASVFHLQTEGNHKVKLYLPPRFFEG